MVNYLPKLFGQLADSPRNHTYIGIEIPGHSGIYLGSNSDINPCLFITAANRIIEPPLKTDYVSWLPNQSYKITLDDGSEIEKLFHVIVCSSPNQTDINTFLLLLEAFIEQNNDNRSATANVKTFFRNIAKLFSISPVRDKTSEQQGLWGELFIMKSLRGFRYWAPFWHDELTDTFDFSFTNKRLEVKTSASGQRIHHMTHRQVFASPGEEIVFASLLVREDSQGISLGQLIKECKTALLGSMDYFKIEKAARHAGMHNDENSGPTYNLAFAAESLAFFYSEDIPHFTMPEPPGVSQTSFRADLSNAAQIDINWLDLWLDTWQINYESSDK